LLGIASGILLVELLLLTFSERQFRIWLQISLAAAVAFLLAGVTAYLMSIVLSYRPTVRRRADQRT
jgi:hypothetical protein